MNYSNTKTAISLPASLFRQADLIADKIKVSRSRLIGIALEEFFKRYENKKMLAALNKCYADEDAAGEKVLKGWRRRHSHLTTKEPW